MMQNQQLVTVWLLTLATTSGCDAYEPAAPLQANKLEAVQNQSAEDPPDDLGVTIEVIGVYRDADVAFVREQIEALIPEHARNRGWGASGNRFEYEASPVMGVEALAKKILFGESVHLDGRRIRVIYRYDDEIPARFHKEPTEFNKPPEDPLGPALKKHNESWVAALKEIRANWQVNKQGDIIGLDLPPLSTTDETLVHVAKLTSLKKLDLTMARFVTDEGARHLASLTNLEELKLFASSIGDPGQAYLRNLTQLKWLSLSGKGTEYGLRHISNLTRLENLSIGFGVGYPVTTVGLEHLKQMKELQELRLDGCEVSDDGLRMIAESFPKLESLQLQDGTMTNAGIAHLAGLQHLRQLGLKECALVGDAGVSHLSDLLDLKSLSLSNTAVTDAGIVHVKLLTNLTYLNLDETSLTDRGIEELHPLQQLASLSLSGTQVTDASIRSLGPLPHLTQLILDKTVITDASLEHLQSFPKLNNLWLSETAITDAGLKSLGTMKQLNTLQIDGTKITDAGMAHLAGLTNLNSLDLSNTSVTVNGLQYLKNAKRLYELRVNDTQITPEELRRFRSR